MWCLNHSLVMTSEHPSGPMILTSSGASNDMSFGYKVAIPNCSWLSLLPRDVRTSNHYHQVVHILALLSIIAHHQSLSTIGH